MEKLFFLFFMLFGVVPAFSENHGRWAGAEHLQLGLAGTEDACLQLGLKDCPNQSIYREDRRGLFSYAEIIVAGDYYDKPEDFIKDTKDGIRRFLKCSDREMNFQMQLVSTEKYTFHRCGTFNYIEHPALLGVISRNYHHFGWHNIVAYVDYHRQALDLARNSFLTRKTNPQLSAALFNRALIINGFADHYLTDAFASGHIRSPRKQIVHWAAENFVGPFVKARADMMTNIFHDYESIDLRTQEEVGLPVTNSLGVQWRTRSDHYLNYHLFPGDLAFEMPKDAVKESFVELVLAWKTGVIPDGIFGAIKYVPFHNDLPLMVKFSPLYQNMTLHEMINTIYSFLPSFKKVVALKSDMRLVFLNVEDLMSRFREDVRKDQKVNSNLKIRVPESYLKAYRNVN